MTRERERMSKNKSLTKTKLTQHGKQINLGKNPKYRHNNFDCCGNYFWLNVMLRGIKKGQTSCLPLLSYN